MLSAPTFEPCGPLTRGKDVSFPNSDNRRSTTSTSESIDSRRRVRFRHTAARVGGRLTAHYRTSVEQRHAIGHVRDVPCERHSVLGGLPIERALRATPPRPRRFLPRFEEPVPPLTPFDTSPSSRSLKSPPNPDRSRSRQRSAPGARPRAPSIDECRAPFSRCEARHRSRGFAASIRLPTLIRRPC